MTKRLHPDDPAVCSAAARLGQIHADLRRAEGRRQRELSLAHVENEEGASTIFEYESLGGSFTEGREEEREEECEEEREEEREEEHGDFIWL